VHVYQSSLVIDKIPQFFNLGELGAVVAAVERVRLNCVHVPVAHPRGSRTIELSLCSRPSSPHLPPEKTGRAWLVEIELEGVV